jgi:hypothetical protein
VSAELDGLGPFARRGQPGHLLRAQLGLAERNVAAMDGAGRDARARLDELRQSPGSPERWEAEHPLVREELVDVEQAFDGAVTREATRRIERQGSHVTRVLGPRPDSDHEAAAQAWGKAAHAIEAYSIAHAVDPSEGSALGSQPAVDGGAWARRRDWRHAGEPSSKRGSSSASRGRATVHTRSVSRGSMGSFPNATAIGHSTEAIAGSCEFTLRRGMTTRACRLGRCCA